MVLSSDGGEAVRDGSSSRGGGRDKTKTARTKKARGHGAPQQWTVLYSNGPFVTQKGGGSGGSSLSVVQMNGAVPTYGYQLDQDWRLYEQLNVTGCGWYIDHIDFYTFVDTPGGSTSSTIKEFTLEVSG